MSTQALTVFICSILFIFQQIGMITADGSSTYCYHREECNPKTWGGSCQIGKNQSPIDIPYNYNIIKEAEPRSLFRSSCYSDPQQFTLRNSNGHTVTAMVEGQPQPRCYVSGNLLSSRTYHFDHIHFHWGSSNNVGSEHTVNKRSHVMEAHLVHYDSTYGNLTGALESGKSDAVAVIGVFFSLSSEDNPAFTPLVRLLKDVKDPNTATQGSQLYLSAFLDNVPYREFGVAQYDGSLTTPGCKEAVLWNVLTTAAPISAAQLDAFRSLTDDSGAPLENNYRPVQKLNSRKIRYYRVPKK